MLRTVEQIEADSSLAIDASPLNTLTKEQAEALVDIQEEGRIDGINIEMSLTELTAGKLMYSIKLFLDVVQSCVDGLQSEKKAGVKHSSKVNHDLDRLAGAAAQLIAMRFGEAAAKLHMAFPDDKRLQIVREMVLQAARTTSKVNTYKDCAPVIAVARLFLLSAHVMLLARSTDDERNHAYTVWKREHASIASQVQGQSAPRPRFSVARG